MIRSDNLILLKVPAFDLLVITSREHVGIFVAYSKASYLPNMSSKCELQNSTRYIPYLENMSHIRENFYRSNKTRIATSGKVALEFQELPHRMKVW